MQDRVGIDSALLLSKIFFAKGEVDKAFSYAKNAVKLSSRLWARLEKYTDSKLDEKKNGSAIAETDSLVEKLAAVDLSSGSENRLRSYRVGSVYWPHFSSHCAVLRQLSRISSHCGLFQDATYYAQQALDVSNSLGASRIAGFIKAELGTYYIRGNQPEKGQKLLEEAGSELPVTEQTIHDVSLRFHVSTLCRYRRNTKDEYKMLDNCHRALVELSQTVAGVSDHQSESEIAEIQTRMSKLNIETTSKSRPQRKARRVHPSEKASKRTEKAPVPKVCDKSIAENPASLSHLRGDVLRRQAAIRLSDDQLQDAATLLDMAEKLPKLQIGQVSQQLQRANLWLNQAIKNLAGHGVYCVLPESCVALPSLQLTRLSNSPRPTSSSTTGSSRSHKKRPKAPSSEHNESTPLVKDDFVDILSIAQQKLDDLFPSEVSHGSTVDGHVYSYLASRISALSYATSKGDVMVDPLRTVQLKGMFSKK